MPSYNSSSAVIGYPTSGDYRVAALQGHYENGSNQIWSSLNLTYSFPTGSALWDGGLNYGKGEVKSGWLPLSAAQQAAVRQALTAWSAVSGLTFTEVPDGTTVGDLRFGFTSAITDPSVLGKAYLPLTDAPSSGDVWLNTTLANKDFSPSVGPFGTYDQGSATDYLVLLHEIGHALGLSHSFAETGETRGTAPLPAAEDNRNDTVMSYSVYQSQYGGIPSTPMPYDILAIQYLYTPNYFTNSGSNTYTYDVNDINLLTIWDASGVDTITVSEKSSTQYPPLFSNSFGASIDLREGMASSIGFPSTNLASVPYRGQPNIYIAYGTVIENAVGTNGYDTITGNAANNRITGGGGADKIDGGAGIDISIYTESRSSMTITKTSTGYTVGSTPTNTDTLTNIERLKFADVSVALDISGNAGTVAKLLGAVFGKTEVANKTYVGIGLNLLDGGMSYPVLMQAALNAKLGAGFSNTAFVNLVYQNVMNQAPSAADLNTFVGLLNSGAYTPASLGVIAAETSFNAANINLTGLANTGIEYI